MKRPIAGQAAGPPAVFCQSGDGCDDTLHGKEPDSRQKAVVGDVEKGAVVDDGIFGLIGILRVGRA